MDRVSIGYYGGIRGCVLSEMSKPIPVKRDGIWWMLGQNKCRARRLRKKETVVMTYETSVKLNTLSYLVRRARSRGECERARRLAAIYWRLAGKCQNCGSSNEAEVSHV